MSEVLSISQQPPRVLTRGLADRLELANRAARGLRGLGVRIVGQDLQHRGRPLLHLDGCTDALRVCCTQVATQSDGAGRREVLARYAGCDLCWTEDAPAQTSVVREWLGDRRMRSA